MAAEFGQADAARLLLDYGADVSLLDEENAAVALGWAAFFGRPQVVAILLAAAFPAEPAQQARSHAAGLRPGGNRGKVEGQASAVGHFFSHS